MKETNWLPLDSAPKYKKVLVQCDGEPTISMWSKASHVPIYGWLDLSKADPEDMDLLRGAVTAWMPLAAPFPTVKGEDPEHHED